MEDAAGAADDALAIVSETAKAQEQLLKNQISGAWTQFGALLNTVTLPILEKVARVINDITDGAAFAKGDVQKLVALSGSENRPGTGVGGARGFDQYNALRSIVTQFNDNPTQFLNGLSRDELDKLGTELARLRASGRYQQSNGSNISAGMITAIREARSALDAKATGDAFGSFAAEGVATQRAAALKADEDAAASKAKADADTEKAAQAAKQRTSELEQQRKATVQDAERLLQELQAKASEAVDGTAGALQSAMLKVLAQGSKALQSGLLSPETSAALTSQLAQFEALQTEMIDAERAAVDTKRAIDAATAKDRGEPASTTTTLTLREKELRVLIAGTKNVAARKVYEEQLSEILDARGDKSIDPNLIVKPKDLTNSIALMGDLAQSIATVGDQLGILPRRSVDALRGIGALVEQGSKLSKVFGTGSTATGLEKFGAVFAIAGGIASLVSGVLSESPGRP